jgi:hypothetical protein
MSVLLANPFHLDPHYFFSPRKLIKVMLFLIFSILLLKRTLSPDKARPVVAFTLVLFAISIAGILARQVEWYGFLQYYPFRVLDAFLPLSFWIGFVLLFQRSINRFRKQAILLFLLIPIVIGGANYLIDRCWNKPKYDLTPRSFAAAMVRTEPKFTAYYVRERGREWYKYLFSHKADGLKEMESWIKGNTPAASVIVAPVTDFGFSVRTERAAFVSLAYVPINEDIFGWKQRLEALNRGTLKNVGFEILPEVVANYHKLTEEDLMNIKHRYGPDYILTTSEARLNLKLVHENTSFRLYKL